MINKNIVFLSYGGSSEYFRAIYSILSLAAWAEGKIEGLRLIVYTDQPPFFRTYLSGFTVVYVTLSPEMLTDMLAGKGFIHRRKVAVIDLTFKNYPNEDLVFIDSDTFFTKEPNLLLQALEVGQSLMHKKEYNLHDGQRLFSSFGQGHYPEAFINYISEREFLIHGELMVFNADDYSHNSGVLGLTKNFVVYMKDVFKLTDAFYAHSKWFISEQMAFSLILQRTTSIVSTEDFITHYWGAHQKLVVDKQISMLINTNSAEVLADRDFLRSSTARMQHLVECDLIAEQMGIALNQRNFIYAAKKSIQYVLYKFFKIVVKK